MCGLVGMLTLGATSEAELDLFKGLLLVDQLRGRHATGVIKVDLKKNEPTYIKRALNAVDFLADADVKKFLDEDKVNLYIGHNRYATMGAKGKHENAHPFQDGHITMVHNGGVDPFGLDLLEGYNDKDVEVDSHMVCKTIAKFGAEEAITKKLSGAFALIWWDSKERSLNFIRNVDRPLYLAVTNQGAMVWASEKAFLDLYLERAGKTSGYRTKPVALKANTLISFKFDEKGVKIGTDPTVTPMQFLELDYPKSYHAGPTWWERSQGITNQSTSRSANANVSAEQATANRVNGVLDRSNLRLRYGDVLSMEITSREPYATNPKSGTVKLKDVKSGQKLICYAVPFSTIEGLKFVRGTLSNAHTSILAGREELNVVVSNLQVSYLDDSYVVSSGGINLGKTTSHGSAAADVAKQREIEDNLAIEEAKKAERDRNTKNLPRTVVHNLINYPLKVQGHTFVTKEDFREFVARGCAFCGNIPGAYDNNNINLTVYQGNGQSGLIDDCDFVCGKCSGE